MPHRIVKRIKKRAIRARGTIFATAVIFLGFWLSGVLKPGIFALLGFVAITLVAILAKRRYGLPARLMRPRKARRVDPIALPAALISAMPDPAVLIDGDDNIILHNERAGAVFGGPRQGMPATSSFRSPTILKAIEKVRQTGEHIHVDYSVAVPVEQHFEILIMPVGQDEPMSLMLLMRDLTRQERAERMRTEFVANASHELRSPLASLLGFVETLQGSAKDDPEARDRFLAIMRAEAARMARLIDDLLSLNRIELNAHVLPEPFVDVVKIVGQVVGGLDPVAKEAGVTLDLTHGEGDFEVQADRDELIQVFQNLIENAIKYGKSESPGEEGDRVEVSISAGDVEIEGNTSLGVTIMVRDFGPGIDEHDIPRLTERFFRVDKSHSREIGGTGLGLAIVKHILNRHRGNLSIASQLGQGTNFIVDLPRSIMSSSRGENN